jgi:hypothetical protein
MREGGRERGRACSGQGLDMRVACALTTVSGPGRNAFVALTVAPLGRRPSSKQRSNKSQRSNTFL